MKKKQIEQAESILGKKWEQFSDHEKDQFVKYEAIKLPLKGKKKLKDIPNQWTR